MQKNITMYRLEEERGQDIRQIILDAIKRHGNVTTAAEAEFGMSRQALNNWIDLLDGHTETRVQTISTVTFDDWAPAESADSPAMKGAAL